MPLFREAHGSGGVRNADSASGATNPDGSPSQPSAVRPADTQRQQGGTAWRTLRDTWQTGRRAVWAVVAGELHPGMVPSSNRMRHSACVTIRRGTRPGYLAWTSPAWRMWLAWRTWLARARPTWRPRPPWKGWFLTAWAASRTSTAWRWAPALRRRRMGMAPTRSPGGWAAR